MWDSVRSSALVPTHSLQALITAPAAEAAARRGLGDRGPVGVGLTGALVAVGLAGAGAWVSSEGWGWSEGSSDETETATDGGVVVVVLLVVAEKALSWISCSPLCSSAMSISIAARPSGEHRRALANLRQGEVATVVTVSEEEY